MTGLCPFKVCIYTEYVHDEYFLLLVSSKCRAFEKPLRLRVFNERKRGNEQRSVRKIMLKECELRLEKDHTRDLMYTRLPSIEFAGCKLPLYTMDGDKGSRSTPIHGTMDRPA